MTFDESSDKSDSPAQPNVNSRQDFTAATGKDPVFTRPVRAPRKSTTRKDLLAAAAIFGVLTVLGLPFGAIWQWVSPRVELVAVRGGFVLAQENPEQYMAADGIFALMGLSFGVVAAVIVWLRFKQRRGTIVLAGLVLGSIECQTVAWHFGRIGRDNYQATLDSLDLGWRTFRVPDLLMTDFNLFSAFTAFTESGFTAGMSHLALGVLGTMAFTAGFVYTMCAGWSRTTDLRTSVNAVQLPPESTPLPESETNGASPDKSDYAR